MAAEQYLQNKIIHDLKLEGWLVNKIKLCSVNGWPDIFAIRKSPYSELYTECLFIEVKAPGKRSEPLQVHVQDQIRQHGGKVYEIDSWEEYITLKLLL